MILVDNILNEREKQQNKINVAIIGAGEMGKGMVNQITRHTPGMRIAVLYNRTIDKALKAFQIAGIENFKVVSDQAEFSSCIENGISMITQDIDLVCEGTGIDVVVEATGAIEFATNVILKAFENGKNVLSFNAELDATIGPVLYKKAKENDVMYTVGDGDQPGVTMNLYRYVKGMGFNPLVCGNIKGLQDHYRNPTTQKNFAAYWNMSPEMATNFADGSKISFEQACIANATGMRVAKRGMLGYESKEHVDDLTSLFDVDQLKELGGIVDYILGAKPGPGVFIYATSEDPLSIKYLDYGKLGKGPLYSFYVPYHLLFFDIGNSIARVVDFADNIISPDFGMQVDVITAAKVDLEPGDVIDCIGGYKTYGLCENYKQARSENLLPMGIAEGCRIKRKIRKDEIISYDDIELPANRLSIKLREELDAIYSKA